MKDLVRQPATLVWLLLVLATGVSWWSARGGAISSGEATAIVMLVAAFKARAVALHFMDLKHAPLVWRLVFEGWAVVCACVILGGYWYAR